jgi:hypothetical protein
MDLEDFFDPPALDYLESYAEDPKILNLDESNHLFVASLYNAAIIYVSLYAYTEAKLTLS